MVWSPLHLLGFTDLNFQGFKCCLLISLDIFIIIRDRFKHNFTDIWTLPSLIYVLTVCSSYPFFVFICQTSRNPTSTVKLLSCWISINPYFKFDTTEGRLERSSTNMMHHSSHYHKPRLFVCKLRIGLTFLSFKRRITLQTSHLLGSLVVPPHFKVAQIKSNGLWWVTIKRQTRGWRWCGSWAAPQIKTFFTFQSTGLVPTDLFKLSTLFFH